MDDMNRLSHEHILNVLGGYEERLSGLQNKLNSIKKKKFTKNDDEYQSKTSTADNKKFQINNQSNSDDDKILDCETKLIKKIIKTKDKFLQEISPNKKAIDNKLYEKDVEEETQANSDKDSILLHKTKLIKKSEINTDKLLIHKIKKIETKNKIQLIKHEQKSQKMDEKNRKLFYTIYIYEDQIFFAFMFFFTIFLVFLSYFLIVRCVFPLINFSKFQIQYQDFCSKFTEKPVLFEQSRGVAILSKFSSWFHNTPEQTIKTPMEIFKHSIIKMFCQ